MGIDERATLIKYAELIIEKTKSYSVGTIHYIDDRTGQGYIGRGQIHGMADAHNAAKEILAALQSARTTPEPSEKETPKFRNYGKCWECGYLGFDVLEHKCLPPEPGAEVVEAVARAIKDNFPHLVEYAWMDWEGQCNIAAKAAIVAYEQAMGDDSSDSATRDVDQPGRSQGSALIKPVPEAGGSIPPILAPTNTVPTDDPNPSVWNWKNTNDGSKWGTPRIAPKDLPTCEEIIE